MAASANNAELMAIALNGSENLVPAAEERSQVAVHRFLSLAPTTSASYPTLPKTTTPKSPVQTAIAGTDAAVEAAIPALPVDVEPKTRRSSSLSSNGSLMSKRRFLKLGPVHFGEGDGDWSEEVIN
ncbi:uncharacterized protein LY89DRAFT_662959 [Mollisia scopiformis]|uniref:Uncharacterized protein n=1 Tax=Mollisia scopiformis TaxID=149040 RepID=A0A194XV53_MOLSC|nr:uncharacterized protein LY89DRAFT_662959 [Mollisia scopiformis]KUJ24205.1 hypothetical protein LY89DRAFT_662959 [Mollisia scopiformis]